MKRPNLLAGEDLPPQPRQKRSQEKRDRLKKAALALFGKTGFEATSIHDIAEQANLAVGGFYQHFRSKRQLLLALMDELLDYLSRLDLRAAGSSDVKAALGAMLASAFQADHRYLGAFRAWREAALSDPDLARKQEKIHAWTAARTEAVLRYLQTQPGARPHVDVPELARVLDRLFWSLLADPKHLRDSVRVATDLVYHAMFRD